MASQFQRPYVDSSFFFAIIKKEETPCPSGLARWQVAERIVKDAERGDYHIYTSTITLAEVRRIRGKQEQLTQNEIQTVQAFFENDFIRLIEVSREIGEKAQLLGAQYGIFPMDALHLATAIHWGCDVLLVWDKRFSARFRDEPIEGVRVIEPYWEGQMDM